MANIVNLDPYVIANNGDPQSSAVFAIPNAATKIVGAVINATWNEALGTKAEFTEKITEVLSGFLNTTTTPHVTAGTIAVPSIAEPNINIPSSVDNTDVMSVFDTKYLELVGMLYQKTIDFRTTYFPDESDTYIAAETRLKDAIANPDAGLPPAVVAQIWGDDQARILGDKTRAQDAVVAQFAARRFPLPPDVAANAVLQIEQKAQDELSESSRKVAILSVELQRFNVENILKLRQLAMSSAVDYIKALASGPDMASRLVGVGYDAQSKLISSAATFMNARTGAAELISKVNQYNNSLTFEAATKNQAADMGMIESKLKALLSEAQAIAQMTTALLNNLHLSASLSSNGGSNTVGAADVTF